MLEDGFKFMMFLTIWLLGFYFIILGIAVAIDYLGSLLLEIIK